MLLLLQYALGIANIKLLMHKPLGGWAAAMAGGILSATGACAATHLAIVVEEDRVLPDCAKTLSMQISGFELWSLEKSARIDLTLRADATCRGRSSTNI